MPELENAVANVKDSQAALESALTAVDSWLQTPYSDKQQKEACARMILCGTANKHIDGIACGTDLVANTWRNFNKPCIPTRKAKTDQGYESLFGLWKSFHKDAYGTTLDSFDMAQYKVLLEGKRRYWNPTNGSVFTSNPFVALHEDNRPLKWNDVWDKRGHEYLKANYLELLKKTKQ